MKFRDKIMKRRRRREAPALYETGAVCAVIWLAWQLFHSL